MTDDELKAAAEAIAASADAPGDPFAAGGWDTVKVARWALRLLGERDELRAAAQWFRGVPPVPGWYWYRGPSTMCAADCVTRIYKYIETLNGGMDSDHPTPLVYVEGRDEPLIAPKGEWCGPLEEPPC